MKPGIEKISSAIEGIDDTYLEEALDYEPRISDVKINRYKPLRFRKISAASVALLVVLGISAAAFAVSRMPLSWRDIFNPDQTVIGDEDEATVISEQIPNSDPVIVSNPKADSISTENARIESLTIDIEKAISDERVLYLLYTLVANEGAVLKPEGRFASFDMYFPGSAMSGAYQQYFIDRREGVPENELEGVIYADWQTDAKAENLVMHFSGWQEKKMFNDATIDLNIAELVANAGENAKLPALKNSNPEYLWQPGGTDIKLPYNGISICNAGWEDGILQLVMKGPKDADEWSTGQNWCFIDTRTGKVINPEPRADYHTPDELDPTMKNADWVYFWNYVCVDKESLPYLEMHWGGMESFTTVLPGEWEVKINATPVTVNSKVLARNLRLSYAGSVLLADRIECSKLSLAVYFKDYVDSTTGILSEFKAFDANGIPVKCNWGFTADPNGNGCMIWTRFDEPIDPESIYSMTFNGSEIYTK